MVNRKWDDDMDENSCITYGEWMRMRDIIKGKTGAVFKNYDPDGTPVAWDAIMTEDSVILHTEWNIMVAWMKSIEPDIIDYLKESYCSLGDLSISSCSEIITNGNLCSRIDSLCPDILNAEDIPGGNPESIVTDGSLCDKIDELCQVGGICPTSAHSSRCSLPVQDFPAYDSGGSGNYWNIFSSCSDQEAATFGIDFGIVRYRPEGTRGGGTGDYGYGYTFIYGGNDYNDLGDRGYEPRRGLNNSLILIPQKPWDEESDPSIISAPTSGDWCSDYTRFEQVYPRVMLKTIYSNDSLPSLVTNDMALDVSFQDEDPQSYHIKFRMQDYESAPTVKTIEFLDFYYNLGLGNPHEAVVESRQSDADLYLKTNGTGLVKFGTFSEAEGLQQVSNPTIIGYITMRDSSGATQLLACLDPDFYLGGGGE